MTDNIPEIKTDNMPELKAEEKIVNKAEKEQPPIKKLKEHELKADTQVTVVECHANKRVTKVFGTLLVRPFRPTNTVKARLLPDFTICDKWYKTSEGYFIAGNKLFGFIQQGNEKARKMLVCAGRPVLPGAIIFKEKEYHLDGNGFLITPDCLNDDGSVVY